MNLSRVKHVLVSSQIKKDGAESNSLVAEVDNSCGSETYIDVFIREKNAKSELFLKHLIHLNFAIKATYIVRHHDCCTSCNNHDDDESRVSRLCLSTKTHQTDALHA